MKRDQDDSPKFDELRQLAEQALREQDGARQETASEDIQHLIHELQVHQVELEMQSEELRKAQLELEVSRKKYFNLFELAPVGYFTIDKNGLILEANLTGANLLGVEKQVMIGTRFSRYIAFDQNVFYFHRRVLFETGTRQTCELKMVKKNGAQFYAQLENALTQDSEGNFSQFQTALMDISKRKQMEEQIKASLEEKEVLLREIHHRVKNNMQIIISLLELQKKHIMDEKALEIFTDSQQRVKSMALVHEKLYQSVNLAKIDFAGYIKSLTNTLLLAYATKDNISFSIDVEDISLSIDVAIPCGLILNELVSNSLKHAFPEGRAPSSYGKKCEIKIILRSVDDNDIELIVSDNGVGLPADLDFRKTKSLGWQLVVALVNQLEGNIELNRIEGTEFRIRFKVGNNH